MTKITAIQTTWLIVSGLPKSCCGMPPFFSASAAQAMAGNRAMVAPARNARLIAMTSATARPNSAEQDQERDQQRIERHRLGQREAQDAQAEHLVARRGVARDAVHQRGEDGADADSRAGNAD